MALWHFKSQDSPLVRLKAALGNSAPKVTGLSLKDQFRLQALLDGKLPDFAFRKKRKALADHLEPRSLVKELMLVELALACG